MALPPPSGKGTTQVFIDITIAGEPAGRLLIDLFSEKCPKTCANFRALCTGEKGMCTRDDSKQLCYKGCKFHRVIKGFMIQSGDITRNNGTGGESIYGPKFDDENFLFKHTSGGLLSMANSGPNTNGSQFFITCAPAKHLDGKHVVFGRVIEGLNIIKAIENIPVNSRSRPKFPVEIGECGDMAVIRNIEAQIEAEMLDSKLTVEGFDDIIADNTAADGGIDAIAEGMIASTQPTIPSANRIATDDTDVSSNIQTVTVTDDTATTTADDNDVAVGGADDDIDSILESVASTAETDNNDTQIRIEAQTTESESDFADNKDKQTEAIERGELPDLSDPVTARLWALKQKRNEATQLNRIAAKAEHNRLNSSSTAYDGSGGDTKKSGGKRKRSRKEWEASQLKKKAQLSETHRKPDQPYLYESAEYASKRKKNKTNDNESKSFGWNTFNTDSLYGAYERRTARIRHRGVVKGDQTQLTDVNSLDYGGVKPVEAEAINEMVAELKATEERRRRFGRRRRVYEDADVSSINKRNKVFNKKVERAYGKYTSEIRANLERGTAL